MTSEVQVALIAAIASTVNIWLTRRAHKKLDHITELTNSTLTIARERIEELERIVRSLKADK